MIMHFQEFLFGVNSFKSLIFLSLFYVIYLIFSLIKKLRSLPPGPVGLPIVGYVPFLKKYAHLQFTELGKKYGDVFSLQLGSRLVVVLNTADAIREGYNKPEFNGRPHNNSFEVLKNISPFFKSENNIWSEHRKLFIHTMKDLGMKNSRMDEIIQAEISHLLMTLRRCKSKPTDLRIPLSPSICNVIGAFVFDERYDYDDPDHVKLDQNITLVLKLLSQTTSRIFFPWLEYVPLLTKPKFTKDCLKAGSETRSIIRKRIQQHVDTLDPNNIRDYIDSYLLEMNFKREKKQDTTLSEASLRGSVTDIYGAGTATTKYTVLWTLYTMAAYPAVQRRVQAEILDVIGPDRKPSYADIKNMPYTHACMMEVMRWKTVAAIPVLQSTTADATLRGFHVPKGTLVMANLWNAHHDPKTWSQPDDFKPERFLSEDGQSLHKHQDFMPFSVGKRSCPGEVLATMEFFHYLVSILQVFDLSFPEDVEPTFDDELDMMYKPKPYLLILTPKDISEG